MLLFVDFDLAYASNIFWSSTRDLCSYESSENECSQFADDEDEVDEDNEDVENIGTIRLSYLVNVYVSY